MPEVITVGPLSVSGTVFAAVLSIAAGMLALLLWIRQSPEARRGPWFEQLGTAIPIVAVCWKFGIVWRDPSLLWERPEILIATTGGGLEALFGVLIACVFWLIGARRRAIPLGRALDPLAVMAAAGIGGWCLLTAPQYRWGYALVCLLVLASLFRSRSAVTSSSGGGGDAGSAVAGAAEIGRTDGLAAITASYGLGAGMLVISLFAPAPPFAPPGEWLGLPERQWLMIAAMLIGVLLQVRRERAAG